MEQSNSRASTSKKRSSFSFNSRKNAYKVRVASIEPLSVVGSTKEQNVDFQKEISKRDKSVRIPAMIERSIKMAKGSLCRTRETLFRNQSLSLNRKRKESNVSNNPDYNQRSDVLGCPPKAPVQTRITLSSKSLNSQNSTTNYLNVNPVVSGSDQNYKFNVIGKNTLNFNIAMRLEGVGSSISASMNPSKEMECNIRYKTDNDSKSLNELQQSLDELNRTIITYNKPLLEEPQSLPSHSKKILNDEILSEMTDKVNRETGLLKQINAPAPSYTDSKGSSIDIKNFNKTTKLNDDYMVESNVTSFSLKEPTDLGGSTKSQEFPGEMSPMKTVVTHKLFPNPEKYGENSENKPANIYVISETAYATPNGQHPRETLLSIQEEDSNYASTPSFVIVPYTPTERLSISPVGLTESFKDNYSNPISNQISMKITANITENVPSRFETEFSITKRFESLENQNKDFEEVSISSKNVRIETNSRINMLKEKDQSSLVSEIVEKNSLKMKSFDDLSQKNSTKKRNFRDDTSTISEVSLKEKSVDRSLKETSFKTDGRGSFRNMDQKQSLNRSAERIGSSTKYQLTNEKVRSSLTDDIKSVKLSYEKINEKGILINSGNVANDVPPIDSENPSRFLKSNTSYNEQNTMLPNRTNVKSESLKNSIMGHSRDKEYRPHNIFPMKNTESTKGLPSDISDGLHFDQTSSVVSYRNAEQTSNIDKQFMLHEKLPNDNSVIYNTRPSEMSVMVDNQISLRKLSSYKEKDSFRYVNSYLMEDFRRNYVSQLYTIDHQYLLHEKLPEKPYRKIENNTFNTATLANISGKEHKKLNLYHQSLEFNDTGIKSEINISDNFLQKLISDVEKRETEVISEPSLKEMDDAPERTSVSLREWKDLKKPSRYSNEKFLVNLSSHIQNDGKELPQYSQSTLVKSNNTPSSQDIKQMSSGSTIKPTNIFRQQSPQPYSSNVMKPNANFSVTDNSQYVQSGETKPGISRPSKDPSGNESEDTQAFNIMTTVKTSSSPDKKQMIHSEEIRVSQTITFQDNNLIENPVVINSDNNPPNQLVRQISKSNLVRPTNVLQRQEDDSFETVQMMQPTKTFSNEGTSQFVHSSVIKLTTKYSNQSLKHAEESQIIDANSEMLSESKQFSGAIKPTNIFQNQEIEKFDSTSAMQPNRGLSNEDSKQFVFSSVIKATISSSPKGSKQLDNASHTKSNTSPTVASTKQLEYVSNEKTDKNSYQQDNRHIDDPSVNKGYGVSLGQESSISRENNYKRNLSSVNQNIKPSENKSIIKNNLKPSTQGVGQSDESQILKNNTKNLHEEYKQDGPNALTSNLGHLNQNIKGQEQANVINNKTQSTKQMSKVPIDDNTMKNRKLNAEKQHSGNIGTKSDISLTNRDLRESENVSFSRPLNSPLNQEIMPIKIYTDNSIAIYPMCSENEEDSVSVYKSQYTNNLDENIDPEDFTIDYQYLKHSKYPGDQYRMIDNSLFANKGLSNIARTTDKSFKSKSTALSYKDNYKQPPPIMGQTSTPANTLNIIEDGTFSKQLDNDTLQVSKSSAERRGIGGQNLLDVHATTGSKGTSEAGRNSDKPYKSFLYENNGSEVGNAKDKETNLDKQRVNDHVSDAPILNQPSLVDEQTLININSIIDNQVSHEKIHLGKGNKSKEDAADLRAEQSKALVYGASETRDSNEKNSGDPSLDERSRESGKFYSQQRSSCTTVSSETKRARREKDPTKSSTRRDDKNKSISDNYVDIKAITRNSRSSSKMTTGTDANKYISVESDKEIGDEARLQSTRSRSTDKGSINRLQIEGSRHSSSTNEVNFGNFFQDIFGRLGNPTVEITDSFLNQLIQDLKVLEQEGLQGLGNDELKRIAGYVNLVSHDLQTPNMFSSMTNDQFIHDLLFYINDMQTQMNESQTATSSSSLHVSLKRDMPTIVNKISLKNDESGPSKTTSIIHEISIYEDLPLRISEQNMDDDDAITHVSFDDVSKLKYRIESIINIREPTDQNEPRHYENVIITTVPQGNQYVTKTTTKTLDVNEPPMVTTQTFYSDDRGSSDLKTLSSIDVQYAEFFRKVFSQLGHPKLVIGEHLLQELLQDVELLDHSGIPALSNNELYRISGFLDILLQNAQDPNQLLSINNDQFIHYLKSSIHEIRSQIGNKQATTSSVSNFVSDSRSPSSGRVTSIVHEVSIYEELPVRSSERNTESRAEEGSYRSIGSDSNVQYHKTHQMKSPDPMRKMKRLNEETLGSNKVTKRSPILSLAGEKVQNTDDKQYIKHYKYPGDQYPVIDNSIFANKGLDKLARNTENSFNTSVSFDIMNTNDQLIIQNKENINSENNPSLKLSQSFESIAILSEIETTNNLLKHVINNVEILESQGVSNVLEIVSDRISVSNIDRKSINEQSVLRNLSSHITSTYSNNDESRMFGKQLDENIRPSKSDEGSQKRSLHNNISPTLKVDNTDESIQYKLTDDRSSHISTEKGTLSKESESVNSYESNLKHKTHSKESDSKDKSSSKSSKSKADKGLKDIQKPNAQSDKESEGTAKMSKNATMQSEESTLMSVKDLIKFEGPTRISKIPTIQSEDSNRLSNIESVIESESSVKVSIRSLMEVESSIKVSIRSTMESKRSIRSNKMSAMDSKNSLNKNEPSEGLHKNSKALESGSIKNESEEKNNTLLSNESTIEMNSDTLMEDNVLGNEKSINLESDEMKSLRDDNIMDNGKSSNLESDKLKSLREDNIMDNRKSINSESDKLKSLSDKENDFKKSGESTTDMKNVENYVNKEEDETTLNQDEEAGDLENIENAATENMLNQMFDFFLNSAFDSLVDKKSAAENSVKQEPSLSLSGDNEISEGSDCLPKSSIIDYKSHTCFSSKVPIKISCHEEHSHMKLYKCADNKNQYKLSNTTYKRTDIVLPKNGRIKKCNNIKSACEKIINKAPSSIYNQILNEIINESLCKKDKSPSNLSRSSLSDVDATDYEMMIPTIIPKNTKPDTVVTYNQAGKWPNLSKRKADCIRTPYGYYRNEYYYDSHTSQALNGSYRHKKEEFVIPKDGIFGRDSKEPKFTNFCCNTCKTWINLGDRQQHQEECVTLSERKHSTDSVRPKLKPRTIKRMPGIICYVCGNRFTKHSIGIHEKSCLSIWMKRNNSLHQYLRKPIPQKPLLNESDIQKLVQDQRSQGKQDYCNEDAINDLYFISSRNHVINLNE